MGSNWWGSLETHEKIAFWCLWAFSLWMFWDCAHGI